MKRNERNDRTSERGKVRNGRTVCKKEKDEEMKMVEEGGKRSEENKQ